MMQLADSGLPCGFDFQLSTVPDTEQETSFLTTVAVLGKHPASRVIEMDSTMPEPSSFVMAESGQEHQVPPDLTNVRWVSFPDPRPPYSNPKSKFRAPDRRPHGRSTFLDPCNAKSSFVGVALDFYLLPFKSGRLIRPLDIIDHPRSSLQMPLHSMSHRVVTLEVWHRRSNAHVQKTLADQAASHQLLGFGRGPSLENAVSYPVSQAGRQCLSLPSTSIERQGNQVSSLAIGALSRPHVAPKNASLCFAFIASYHIISPTCPVNTSRL